MRVRPAPSAATRVATAWLAPWAAFVLAVLVGGALVGDPDVDRGVLVLGLPLAWACAWVDRHRSHGTAAAAVGALAVVGGVLGLLAP